jgi:hypothetical protein
MAKRRVGVSVALTMMPSQVMLFSTINLVHDLQNTHLSSALFINPHFLSRINFLFYLNLSMR